MWVSQASNITFLTVMCVNISMHQCSNTLTLGHLNQQELNAENSFATC